jgi:DNA-binding winged helix-turn-helix (wHTH) protein
MLSRLGRRRVCIGLATCLFLAFVFAATAAIVAHSVLRNRAEELRSRCVVYATTVADTIPIWAAHSATPDLSSVAHYAVLSGLLYIQVTSGDTVLLEAAGFPNAEDALAKDQPPPLPRVELRRVGGRHLVDVVVRYAASSARGGGPALGPYAAGRVRLGIDASALAWAATNTKALTGGLTALAWIVASGGCFFLLRASRSAARADGDVPEVRPAGARTVEAGSLTLYVDEARLAAAGRSIHLTPKQLDLLKVLISDPGRTFSDEEILCQAWPGSPYADSKDVKQYVYLIRQRLNGAGLPGDRILVNVPGVGYRIDPTVAVPIEEPVDSGTIESRLDGDR